MRETISTTTPTSVPNLLWFSLKHMQQVALQWVVCVEHSLVSKLSNYGVRNWNFWALALTRTIFTMGFVKFQSLLSHERNNNHHHHHHKCGSLALQPPLPPDGGAPRNARHRPCTGREGPPFLSRRGRPAEPGQAPTNILGLRGCNSCGHHATEAVVLAFVPSRAALVSRKRPASGICACIVGFATIARHSKNTPAVAVVAPCSRQSIVDGQQCWKLS